jgi:separase
MSILLAQDYLVKFESEINTAIKIQWHLAYIEYLVGIGNLDKGLSFFSEAECITSLDSNLSIAKTSASNRAARVAINRMIADAAYVTSLIAYEKVPNCIPCAHANVQT